MKKQIFGLVSILVLGSVAGCNRTLLPTQPPTSSSNQAVPAAPSLVKQWNQILVNGVPGHLVAPMAVAVDRNNHVYVADSYWDLIFVFDSNGQFITQWGQQGFGGGQLYSHTSLAVSPAGNLFVALTTNPSVVELDSNGNVAAKIGSPNVDFSYPGGIAFDRTGNLFVSDERSVWEFNSNLAPVSQFTAGGQLFYAMGLAIDGSGDIDITDYTTSSVLKFNPSTGAVTGLGTSGSGPGQFSNPMDVKLDSYGNAYVVDFGNNRIEIFNSDGTFIQQFGNTGSSPMISPTELALDSNGYAYVVDNGNSRILKYAIP